MGKRKVTLDTNILISALGWKGNPNIILNKVIEGEITLFISYAQFEEFLEYLITPNLNSQMSKKQGSKRLYQRYPLL